MMHPAVPEWLGPFWHSSYASGRVRMARTILALKSCNLHGCARMARAILHSSSASGVTCVQEWLKPFWHCQKYLSARMARAILARLELLACKNGLSHFGLKYGWQCQNGSSHYGTQIWFAVPDWLEPFLHAVMRGRT